MQTSSDLSIAFASTPGVATAELPDEPTQGERNQASRAGAERSSSHGSLDPLGFVAQLCLAARTPEEALACACRTSALWSPIAFSLRRERDLMMMQAHLPEGVHDAALHVAATHSVFQWIELVERVAKSPVYPQAVYLPALDHVHRERLRRTFSCPLHFAEPIVGVVFRASDLQIENTRFDQRLFALLSEHVSDRLADRDTERATSERLLHALRQLDDVSNASAESLACALGMGVRTLHRRLRAEHKSYRGVLEEFRMQRCLVQLRVPSASAKRIAFSLGFANPASFHRAFKRWTGRTVGEYRRDRAPCPRSSTYLTDSERALERVAS